jgi:hypothetical protein
MKMKFLAAVITAALVQVAQAAPVVVARPVVIAPRPVVVARPAPAVQAKPPIVKARSSSSATPVHAPSNAWLPLFIGGSSEKDCDFNYTEKCEKK